jgi:hypothetical protein
MILFLFTVWCCIACGKVTLNRNEALGGVGRESIGFYMFEEENSLHCFFV